MDRYSALNQSVAQKESRRGEVCGTKPYLGAAAAAAAAHTERTESGEPWLQVHTSRDEVKKQRAISGPVGTQRVRKPHPGRYPRLAETHPLCATSGSF